MFPMEKTSTSATATAAAAAKPSSPPADQVAANPVEKQVPGSTQPDPSSAMGGNSSNAAGQAAPPPAMPPARQSWADEQRALLDQIVKDFHGAIDDIKNAIGSPHVELRVQQAKDLITAKFESFKKDL
jgi:hypothetical protein